MMMMMMMMMMMNQDRLGTNFDQVFNKGRFWLQDGIGNNSVANNSILDYCLLLNDCGGIYTLGAQPGSSLIGEKISLFLFLLTLSFRAVFCACPEPVLGSHDCFNRSQPSVVHLIRLFVLYLS